MKNRIEACYVTGRCIWYNSASFLCRKCSSESATVTKFKNERSESLGKKIIRATLYHHCHWPCNTKKRNSNTEKERERETERQRERQRDRKKESLCTYNDFFVCERECVCVHKLRLSQGKQVTFLNWTTFCLLSLSLGLAMAVIRQT